MKTNFEKYMKEVWESKEQVYQDFKKSGMKHYIDFIKNELKDIEIDYYIQDKENITGERK
jgi:uncharacterized protein (DUF488 family)